MAQNKQQIYLSLGSNLGDRKKNLLQAREELIEADVQIKRISPLYKTAPVDFTSQPWFLNQVLSAETGLTPLRLLAHCRGIEDRLGRQRTIAKGPRTIDIDILLYGDWILEGPSLTIPHPGLPSRRFVLVPLAGLAPDLIHPVLNESIQKILEGCQDTASVVLFK
jgi:2-amino-4-hydroxy-6-hydroxymethyldihydropteridine diphosphokinase